MKPIGLSTILCFLASCATGLNPEAARVELILADNAPLKVNKNGKQLPAVQHDCQLITKSHFTSPYADEASVKNLARNSAYSMGGNTVVGNGFYSRGSFHIVGAVLKCKK